MNDQYKDTLMKFTLAAKAVLYDARRMEPLLKMMKTVSGTINAVQTVLAAIGQKKPVPPEIAPLLAVNVFMLMVDVARQVSGKKPPAKMMDVVVKKLLDEVQKAHPPGPPQTQTPDLPTSQPAAQPAQAGGLIQGAQA